MNALLEFYDNWYLDIWIVAVGGLSAMACALIGCFLLLRKMSMMGDAISHTVLPGLALAFLITHRRDPLTMFVGAVVIGLLSALLIQAVTHFSRLEEGASMGVIFTSLFALGLILIRRAADHVDIDPGCVLYGAVELTPLQTLVLGGWELPRAALILGMVLLFNLAFVLLLYKELQVSSFDPELSSAIGINAHLMHYLLMTVVAVTVVASFESVGSIMVIAMLIVPAACARQLTQRLAVMLPLSLAFGFLSALLGHLGAVRVPRWFGFAGDTSSAGMMCVAAGVLFLTVFFLSPSQGLLPRWLKRLRLALTIQRDDVLAYLYRRDELAEARTAPAIGRPELRAKIGGRTLSLALNGLLQSGKILRSGDGFRLSAAGRRQARDLIRSHRLWEAYLDQNVAQTQSDLHYSAEALEHVTDPQLQSVIADAAGSPQRDPHDRKIPRARRFS